MQFSLTVRRLKSVSSIVCRAMAVKFLVFTQKTVPFAYNGLTFPFRINLLLLNSDEVKTQIILWVKWRTPTGPSLGEKFATIFSHIDSKTTYCYLEKWQDCSILSTRSFFIHTMPANSSVSDDHYDTLYNQCLFKSIEQRLYCTFQYNVLLFDVEANSSLKIKIRKKVHYDVFLTWPGKIFFFNWIMSY